MCLVLCQGGIKSTDWRSCQKDAQAPVNVVGAGILLAEHGADKVVDGTRKLFARRSMQGHRADAGSGK